MMQQPDSSRRRNPNLLPLSQSFNPSISNPQVYQFSGNTVSVSQKSLALTAQQLSPYSSLRLEISGTMIKSNNACCFWNTIVWGSIFVFPLFFICCDWWKRIVNRVYQVGLEGYQGIGRIISNSRAEELYVTVQDSLINRSKIQVITKAIQRSSVRNFVFNNVAVGFNAQGKNFTQFSSQWKIIQEMGIRADITWGNQFVH